jgi:uncharacterized protein YecE (DUF72 family)
VPNSREIYLGTSGWHYDHWQGRFYPEGLATDAWLKHYANQFTTMEINNSFYQLPEAETLARWRADTPDGFVFSVKASRYITHMKKLKEPEEPVTGFLERVDLLQEKLGPILFQLPPRWNYDRERLESFLETLPKGYRYTFEFRDPSWFNAQAYEALARHNAAFCMYHLAGRLSPKEITTDWVYVRLHGPDAAYEGKYGKQALAGWAGALSAWLDEGKTVYCYFDNDQRGYAVENALELKAMMNS